MTRRHTVLLRRSRLDSPEKGHLADQVRRAHRIPKAFLHGALRPPTPIDRLSPSRKASPLEQMFYLTLTNREISAKIEAKKELGAPARPPT